MSNPVAKAGYAGVLKIADMEIPCAVLDDLENTRVVSEREVTKALGGKRGGAHWRRMKKNPGADYLPIVLSAPNLSPYIDDELRNQLKNPIVYSAPTQGGRGYGIPASALPKICDVWLKARDAGKVLPSQEHMAKAADILLRGLAHVGIIALVDEATGFQTKRTEDALKKVLDKFLLKEYAAWSKRFPNEFYEKMFDLKRWPWNAETIKRKPGVVGKYTNDIVYDRLAPGVLKALREKNPPNDKGVRPVKHHQFLTVDTGLPALNDHLVGVLALMRASADWNSFNRALTRAYPKFEEQVAMALDD